VRDQGTARFRTGARPFSGLLVVRETMNITPWRLILIGFLLSLMGVILPFLMVMHILESTFFLNFLSYGCMMSGFFLGIIGAARVTGNNRKQK
jgi:hypothetical protein